MLMNRPASEAPMFAPTLSVIGPLLAAGTVAVGAAACPGAAWAGAVVAAAGALAAGGAGAGAAGALQPSRPLRARTTTIPRAGMVSSGLHSRADPCTEQGSRRGACRR